MSEAYPAAAAVNIWPPREGRRFFLLWIGATLAGWIALRVLSFESSMSVGSTGWRDHYWLNAIPVGVGLFQGWLLFGKRPRMIGWGLLPAMHVSIPYLARGGSATAWSTWFGFASIVTTVIAALLLVGIRRKPWLWLFINLGVLVINQVLITVLVAGVGLATLDRVANQMNSLLGLPSALTVSGTFLFSWVNSGIWLAGAMLEACALAWWMPPLDAGTQVVPAITPAMSED